MSCAPLARCWNTSDAERRKRKAEVKYAWGGMEVLSAGLVRAIVGPRCIERVAAVRCRGWGRGRDANLCEWAVDFEDAAVGLCAHLLGARLTEQRCFARYEEGHQKWECSKPQKKAVCYAFQKGECSRGASCRFAHE